MLYYNIILYNGDNNNLQTSLKYYVGNSDFRIIIYYYPCFDILNVLAMRYRQYVNIAIQCTLKNNV